MIEWIANNFVYFASGFFFLLITATMADNTFFLEDRENILKDYLAKQYRNHPSKYPMIIYSVTYIIAFISLFLLNSARTLVTYCVVQLIVFTLYNLALDFKIKYKTCDIMCFAFNVLLFIYLNIDKYIF